MVIQYYFSNNAGKMVGAATLSTQSRKVLVAPPTAAGIMNFLNIIMMIMVIIHNGDIL
jgi:hypothetical protein